MDFPLDTNVFIGIPYKERGRGYTGCDCYGLFRLVYGSLGIDLPDHSDDYISVTDQREILILLDAGMPDWRPVESGHERATDGILLRLAGRPYHVGVIIGQGRFIHTMDKAGACIESYRSVAYNRRVLGFFRHARLDSRAAD